MNDIHENLAPIIPTFFTMFDWVILGVFIVGVFVTFWFMSFKTTKIKNKQKQKIVKKKFVPKRFSFEKELKKLDKLGEKKQWKEFVLFATVLLKNILEQKYKIVLDFATGKEMEEILSKKNVADKEKEYVEQFFALVDPIKFANKQGKEETVKQIISLLREVNKKDN